MKKKIAFVIATFMIGGQEKALISMLNEIPRDKYDITILTLFDEGEFKAFVPDWVRIKVIPRDNFNVKKNMIENMKKLRIIKLVEDLYYIINLKLSKTKARQNYYSAKLSREITDEYDVIIHYHSTESYLLHYIAYKMKANAKIAWIHSDISNNMKIDNKIFNDIYSKYDKIFSVSQASLDKFIQIFPQYKYKTEIFYNIIDSNQIRELSLNGEGFGDNFKGKRILTVGRLCIDKGQELIPDIVKMLIKDGYDIKWYLIGEGDTRSILERSICNYELQDKLILLGSRINPYTYMRDCDIYVQPSVSEGLCITLTEARCFNKPIVATDFNGAKEQIEDGKTGYIVSINDKEQIYDAIKRLLDDENITNIFSNNLSDEDPSTIEELEKLYRFVDNI